eukprot:GHVR01081247.1.p1 GENE.GHVR01081247.1~~GHVR01081247.1.p1  ORF type:complete len:140 (+),score=11.94 GHVR01081247.1:129-548(+)
MSKIVLPEISNDNKNKSTPLLIRDSEKLKNIKSESYCIMEYPSEKVVLVHRANNALEIASLTKIMTFYVVLQIIKNNSINIASEKWIVREHIMDLTGTSAEIIEGEIYTIEELLYGLMLPSGNDAAICLAEWGGGYLMA